MELYKLTVHEAADLINKKEVTPQQIVESALQQINSVDKDVKAFITLTDERALEESKQLDTSATGKDGLSALAGIPFGVEDNICTEGVRTTCASKMLENFVPPYSATVVSRLAQQKGILVGKLNIDEFSMGLTSESSYFHETRNPWDLNRVAGGASAGAAAAVAADEVFYALATDAGGSLRRAAAFCGVVGLKPTYGMVSRYGVISSGSSMDQVGPVAKDVKDCAIVFQAIAGRDMADPMTAKAMTSDYVQALVDDVKGLRIGVLKECFDRDVDKHVKDAVLNAVRTLEGFGARVEEVSLPSVEHAPAAYCVIVSAEASSNLGRYDGIKYGYRVEKCQDLDELYKKTRTEGFGDQVKLRVMLGTHILSAGNYERYYLQALKIRTIIKNEFEKAFEKYDVIVMPTCPTSALKFGESMDSALAMFLADKYTAPASIAGLPAITVPCGFDSQGLPIGMQLVGKAFDESTLLRAAFTFEQNTDYHIKRPAIGWR
jgi:aspartyl-tRNA(Asn)/glutamyl-tRNA(Gln) amidotransferase subunit A